MHTGTGTRHRAHAGTPWITLARQTGSPGTLQTRRKGGARGNPSRAQFRHHPQAIQGAAPGKKQAVKGKKADKKEYVCMNKFHYSINSLFVPDMSPPCPRFVPASHRLQTRMNTGFCHLSPVSPAFLRFLGERLSAAGIKKTARPGYGGAALGAALGRACQALRLTNGSTSAPAASLSR